MTKEHKEARDALKYNHSPTEHVNSPCVGNELSSLKNAEGSAPEDTPEVKSHVNSSESSGTHILQTEIKDDTISDDRPEYITRQVKQDTVKTVETKKKEIFTKYKNIIEEIWNKYNGKLKDVETISLMMRDAFKQGQKTALEFMKIKYYNKILIATHSLKEMWEDDTVWDKL